MGPGDDVVHAQVPFYELPRHISSNAPDLPEDAVIDLVFLDYIKPRVVEALISLTGQNYTTDIKEYSPKLSNTFFGLYAKKFWKNM